MRARTSLLAPGISLVLFVSMLPMGAAVAFEPDDPRGYSWEQEGVLARGGGGLDETDVDWLHSQGFRSILNLRAEHPDPAAHIKSKGMEYLYLPIDHAVDINVTQLQQFVAWMEERIDKGQTPVYMHCTNGWHRAAAFAAAWEMHRNGVGFDEAEDIVKDRRQPGTVIRSPAPLLRYDALLQGEPTLTVLLLADVAHKGNGATMPAAVEVLDDKGKPKPGADVHLWSEEGKMDLRGTTDSKGRLAFTYKAPATAKTDHLYVRASAAGFMDGGDNVEMFFGESLPTSRPLELRAARDDAGVSVQVLRNGKAAAARLVASTPQGDFAFDATATGRTHLPLPAGRDVFLRAESWGSTNATALFAPGATPPPPPDPQKEIEFESRGGNEWWLEARVRGSAVASLVGVEARDDNSPWKPMKLQTWGGWTVSFRIEAGHRVELRATLLDGSTRTSCPFTHPEGEPQCPAGGTPPPPPPPSAYDVTFDGKTGNEWWVQVKLRGSDASKATSVEAREEGGAWKPLTLRSWGDWAASVHIAPGKRVEYRAHMPDGSTTKSCPFTHPDAVEQCGGTTPPPPPPPSGFDARFEDTRGNSWWIETEVKVQAGTLAKVEGRVDGGEWKTLSATSWGSWARSTHAPTGSQVVFRATGTDGGSVLSPAYVWPPT